MQNSSTPSPDIEYIPRDDESEANRLLLLNGADPDAGLGDAVYLTDEEVRQYSMGDFGVDFDWTAESRNS